MIANLTAQDLAAHLEQRLRRMGEAKSAARAYNPMLTAFLGPAAAGDCPAVAGRLGRYWPESCPDLKFLGLETPEAGYTELGLWGEAPLLLEGNAARLASALFDTRTHFENYGRLLAFYLLDSADFADETDLRRWLDALRRLREEIRRGGFSDMLILLLDEEKEAAGRIRRELGLISREEEDALPAVLVLSGRRSDNRIDRKPCLSIITALMAVLNSADGPEDLFDPGLLAAGYGCEEKPLAAIANTVARTLLEWLSGGPPETEERLFADREALKTRLGISREGTFSFLDGYVSGTLMPYVPSRKHIEHFPIPAPDSANHARLSSSTISSKELNEFTFGAWDFCLTEAVKRARERIEKDLPDFRRWREEYAGQLRARFTPGEQVILAEKLDWVKGLLKFARLPSRDLPALLYAERWLHYLADSSPELLDALAAEIQRQGEESAALVRKRGKLLSSLDALAPVEDGELSGFYRNLLDGFLTRRGEALRREFLTVRKEEDLPRFLEKTVEDVLRDAMLQPVFALDVEGELQARMGASGGVFGGDGTPVYLHTEEELEEPIWTLLLYRMDSALGAYFREHLPEDMIFYDTGRGSVLEALRVFRLEAEDLYPYEPGELPPPKMEEPAGIMEPVEAADAPPIPQAAQGAIVPPVAQAPPIPPMPILPEAADTPPMPILPEAADTPPVSDTAETVDMPAETPREAEKTADAPGTTALSTVNSQSLSKADAFQMRLMRRVIPEPGDPHWMDTEEPLWLDSDEFLE